MTDRLHAELPPALRRALDLLIDPPANPDVSKGYLDLLTDGPATSTPKNTGAIQAVWASGIGSMLYDNAQALARRLASVWRLPIDWLSIPPGGVALDVGSGPGNVTAQLADAAGTDGLALGIDISEPMLARAVEAQAGPNVGFMRADAQRLPLRDETVDAATSLAVLQLIPNPAQTLAEIARVLKPGGRVALMVPTAGNISGLAHLLPKGGANFFAEDELADILEDLGLVGVRTKTVGTFQWVRARRP
ncbi:methyltransferase domain-containing protein [Mycolicibacterium tusciae]|uniref:methyltransferase domain-containing protein n=1 Tax=Mycolicibacterium tusciae TaxID=75922 RepID=UPI00024A3609|nr:methyltransferase domain-containing protein [Mycolicibacterium tusciae]